VIVLFMRIPQLRHVRQCETNDCGIAAAAIAAGVSYEIAASKSPVWAGKRGLSPANLMHLLRKLTRIRWQWEPFSPSQQMSRFFSAGEAQVLVVRLSQRPPTFHYIVVKDGRVYDPALPESSRTETYRRRDCPVVMRFWPQSRREWIADRLRLVGCALLVFMVVWTPLVVAACLTNGFK
jgi:hypothetical protein